MGLTVPGYLRNVQLHKTMGLVLGGLQFAWKVVRKSCQFTWKLQTVSFRRWQSFNAITLDEWPAWQLDFFILLPLLYPFALTPTYVCWAKFLLNLSRLETYLHPSMGEECLSGPAVFSIDAEMAWWRFFMMILLPGNADVCLCRASCSC